VEHYKHKEISGCQGDGGYDDGDRVIIRVGYTHDGNVNELVVGWPQAARFSVGLRAIGRSDGPKTALSLSLYMTPSQHLMLAVKVLVTGSLAPSGVVLFQNRRML